MFSGFKIVVLESGFVYVGDVSEMDKGIVVASAKNIRVWGTTKGLGELALGGPTSNTVLDNVGELFAPTHAILHVITTDPIKWV